MNGPSWPVPQDRVAMLASARVDVPEEPARQGGVPDPGEAAELGIAGDPELWRRRLRHDIRHELGTIIMLASAVVVSEDVGPRSRERIEQLLGETRWLDHLLRQLEDDGAQGEPAPERIRVDDLVGEIVDGLRLATPHEVRFTAEPSWAYMDSLSLWRAVRNILDNACRVATRSVDVRVRAERGRVCVRVDDDGPGFGPGAEPGPRGLGSLGLGIVHDLVSGYGGSLEIRHCETGGASVCVLLPEAPSGPEG
jgi:signal transduction histidine kinase